MTTAVKIVGGVFAYLLLTAWLNGVFLRCPYCHKIGSWRFDAEGPAVEEKDEDGCTESRRQVRVCRKCKKTILDEWSDQNGRVFAKVDDANTA
jgi:pyruvate-formate lyase-activating enzyme